jgi:alpha-2-macroglobulin
MKHVAAVRRTAECPALGILLLSVVFLTKCGDRGPEWPQSMSVPIEAARLVSEATGGVVSANDCIRVRFTSPAADESQVSADPADPKKLPGRLFRFDPDIKGFAYWLDVQTLVFKPSRPMKTKTRYRGLLSLEKIFHGIRKPSPPPLPLQFTVASREIASFTGDFELVNGNNPLLMAYQGAVEFTESVLLADLQKASRFSVNSGGRGIEWAAEADGKKFRFKSTVIRRDENEKAIQFKIDKSRLDLGSDFIRDAFLPPLTEMAVTDLSVRTGDQKAFISVLFSDELDTKSDAGERVGVQPSIDARMTVLGREIRITGGFDFGRTYTVRIRKGVRSRWGTLTRADYEKTVSIDNLKPRMRFMSDGAFVPSANDQKIRFETVNLKRVRLNIMKVFESNIGQFLQTQKLTSSKSRNEDFDRWDLQRVGVDVVNDTLEIGDGKNVWLQQELDLKKLLKKDARGMFLITLNFKRKDMLYNGPGNEPASDDEGDDGYSGAPDTPGSWNYMNNFARIYKPVVFSDIGLTCKAGASRFLVFATDILKASPLKGAAVTLRTYQNQSVGSAETDGNGIAEFKSVPGDVFAIEAEKDGQKSVIKLSEMAWNLSGFDTGGEEAAPDGLRAFIFPERGVHRPGEEVHLSLIARNQDGTFPDNHPVGLKVFNPKNQMVFEQVRKDASDGFYHFSFQTRPEDMTGNWLAVFRIGSRTFEHTVKIETVAPYTLKVELKSDRESLGPGDRSCVMDLNARTLFGAPAGGYQGSVQVEIRPKPKVFPGFPDFAFDNMTVEYKSTAETVFDGPLDVQGGARFEWFLPSPEKAPSALEAVVSARVLEKGGRPNLRNEVIPIDPFPRYVGIKPPGEGSDYVRTGVTIDIPVVLADGNGIAAPGRILNYRVYRNQQYWWWEYENQSDYRLRFKTDHETQLIKQGALTSGEGPVNLAYPVETRGQYFIEIQDGKEGHSAGLFFSAYEWGEVPSGGDQADLLVLKTDRKQYRPGDKAEISFPSPTAGAILVTVEKGCDILSFEWAEPARKGDRTRVSIPVTDRMMPNAYVTVSIIQPHAQTQNDRPIRMYGVVPLFVADPSTRHELTLTTTPFLEPDKKFSVEIRTGDAKPTQFVLAVVDEGLLDLTRFQTPDPWKAFFRKQRLGVATSDLFSQIVGANKGDVFKTFSIGGGMEEEYRESQQGAEKTKRFKPVAMFKGPVLTDKKGYAKVEFVMPSYVGSVRIMAVSARKQCYGSAEKTVPVKSDLIVLPSLPRVLGPNDKILLPVSVFAMEKGIGRVDVSIDVKGPVSVIGGNRQSVVLADKGEKDVQFQLLARPAVGTAVITVNASSSGRSVRSVTEIAVRSSSARIFESQEKTLSRGESVSLTVPNKGLEGTNQATLTLWRRPQMNLDRRLRWLIHYPYGCIEQTMSSVFPQLYLKTILKNGTFDEAEIDRNINGGIDRLRKFQLASGGFAYWPGTRDLSVWGTDYAGHFLAEAKRLGYAVPEDMFKNWLAYEKNAATVQKDGRFVQAYRLYLLALAGSPQIGPMNVLKEDSSRTMNDAEKWLLAGAYKTAGVEKTAQELLRTAGVRVEESRPCWYWWQTYGTGLRDKAVILEMAVLFERWPEANGLLDELARNLASEEWFSTQTTGQMLLAIGRYFKANENAINPVMSGTVRMPDGGRKKFKTDGINYSLNIQSGFGMPLEIELDPASTVNRVFCTLSWNGVPLVPDFSEVAKNLKLSVEWLGDDGKSIDPANLKQGTVFWGHFTAGGTPASRVDNVALVQVLPSGWEIENIRLTGEDLPAWATAMHLNRFEYQDLRDDRVMWFFNVGPSYDYHNKPDNGLDFLVKLNAVTPGEFVLPPTLLEAMYDANFQARKGGRKVGVEL